MGVEKVKTRDLLTPPFLVAVTVTVNETVSVISDSIVIVRLPVDELGATVIPEGKGEDVK